MILLTTSRNALLAALITLFLLIPYKKYKFLFISIFTALGVLMANLIPIFPSNIQTRIFAFLPATFLEKTDFSSISEFTSYPRIELWLKSIKLIKSNLFMGYGGGSFSDLYYLNNGQFEGMQHSHNIVLEIAFNYGLPSSLLIIGGMLFITIKSTNGLVFNQNKNILETKNYLNKFDYAWIISFSIFLFLHMFDITYFDGRISLLAWILLSGIRQIIRENKENLLN
jgi:O-antigen ligase